MSDQQAKAFEAFEHIETIQFEVHSCREISKEGWQTTSWGTSKDLPDDLAEIYKTDPEEDYNQRKTRIQWIRRYWAEQWFKYKFVTQEYAEKNAIKSPWGDILYRGLPPKNKDDGLALSGCGPRTMQG